MTLDFACPAPASTPSSSSSTSSTTPSGGLGGSSGSPAASPGLPKVLTDKDAGLALLARVSAELRVVDERTPALIDRIGRGLLTGRPRSPVMPQSALRLLQMTGSADVSFDDLARHAVTDPAVAGSVMRHACSAAQAARTRPAGVKEALVRLGIQGARQVAWDVAMSSKIARRGRFFPVMERILRHGRTASALAGVLARELGIPAGPAALAGLLHAVGGMVIVDEMMAQRDLRVADSVVFLAVRRLHAWAGGMVVKGIGVDNEVIIPLVTHHDADLTKAPMLVRLLAFVDLISPSEPAQRAMPLPQAIERTALPLTDQAVRRRLGPIIASVDELMAQG